MTRWRVAGALFWESWQLAVWRWTCAGCIVAIGPVRLNFYRKDPR